MTLQNNTCNIGILDVTFSQLTFM